MKIKFTTNCLYPLYPIRVMGSRSLSMQAEH